MDHAIIGWDVALFQGNLVAGQKNVAFLHCDQKVVASVEREQARTLGQGGTVFGWGADVNEDKLTQKVAVFFQQ